MEPDGPLGEIQHGTSTAGGIASARDVQLLHAAKGMEFFDGARPPTMAVDFTFQRARLRGERPPARTGGADRHPDGRWR